MPSSPSIILEGYWVKAINLSSGCQLERDELLDRDTLTLDFRALPYLSRVHPAQVGKCRQDAAGETALATVDAGLTLLAP